jgi:hypothetical protein
LAELTRTALYGLCEREAAVITTKNIVWVLALGAVWGVAELFGKDLLADFGVGGASIWLAAWAILLLSIGRGLWNKIGSSAIIGFVAAAFKFAGPSTNYCHLLGIAALGLFFDLFASSLLAQGRSQWWRPALVGVLTAYGARAFFVWFSVSVAQSDRWWRSTMPCGAVRWSHSQHCCLPLSVSESARRRQKCCPTALQKALSRLITADGPILRPVSRPHWRRESTETRQVSPAYLTTKAGELWVALQSL